MARSRRQGRAPCIRRLHLDCVRFAIGWHLGITLGICMSGLGNLVMLADNGEMMSVLNGKRSVKSAVTV